MPSRCVGLTHVTSAKTSIRLKNTSSQTPTHFSTTSRLSIPKQKLLYSEDQLTKGWPYKSRDALGAPRPQVHQRSKINVRLDLLSQDHARRRHHLTHRRPLTQILYSLQDPIEANNQFAKAARSRILNHAHRLSAHWPGPLRLDVYHNGHITPTTTTGSSSSSPAIEPQSTTPITTNFIIHLPAQSLNTIKSGRISRSQILRNLHLLLLKRRPNADTLPDAWTAISGRIERDGKGMLEVPVLSALREIREETSLPAQALEVKAALPPYILDDGERKWQIWAMLWLRVAPDDDDGRHGNGGLKLSRVERLGAQVTLNHENVKCRWDSLVEFDKLEGKVPGLLDTFVKLVDVWIEREGTERRVLRKAKSNGQDSE